MTDNQETGPHERERLAPLVNVTCFSHVGISVSDLETSVDFYTRLLGFTRRFVNEEEGWARVGLAVGDIQLELFSPWPGNRGETVVNPFYPKEFGRPKLALTVVDVDGTYARLVAAGIVPLCPVTTTPVSKFFFITDPDDTPIQLHEFKGGERRVTELFR
jgi:catechol 2,3-dioxygenase-like lactoylglutathione lyase family enzyme